MTEIIQTEEVKAIENLKLNSLKLWKPSKREQCQLYKLSTTRQNLRNTPNIKPFCLLEVLEAHTVKLCNRSTRNNSHLVLNTLQITKSVTRVRRVLNVYSNVNHILSYCSFKLITVEKNPGPHFLDPTKTIHAPYSQGNQRIFGENAGKQCTAMSLSYLLYVNKYPISSPADLIKIMNTGNELYSFLSKSSRKTFLMLSELPTTIIMYDTHFEVSFSESYTCPIHVDENAICTINNFQYCMPLQNAIETLIAENFLHFLLTINCTTIAIQLISSSIFKVFDSHARDSFGMTHNQL